MPATPQTVVHDTIHATVQAQALRTPDAVAVVHGPVRVDYRELDRRSDDIARHLTGLGVGPGVFVPVRLPRSVSLVATVLGVLKTGAAYSLIDAGWPDERVADVLRQTRAELLVTDAPLPDGFPAPVPVWSPAVLPAEPGPAFVPRHRVTPADPACVYFTSGSTGRPKGAVSPHSGTVRLVAEDGFADFGPGTVMPLVAAMPWDLFTLELWAPLLTGGTVVVVDEPYLSGDTLRGLVRDGVTTVWTTTSLFNMLVDEEPDCFTGLGTVMVGGERLSPPHVAAFLAAQPDIPLINGYGPVENTVFSSTHRIRPEDSTVPGGIPIGVPVPGTRVYVLDPEGRECPDGTLGELCFAGEGLAVEYLGQPALTAEKFPVLELRGRSERVYRSGDLGLRDAEGLLHYRGRADRQVKIRGHRVEPEEVEAVIRRLPGVARCVVLPALAPDGACTGLLAFATGSGPDPLDPPHLLARMRTLVPGYQIPESLTEVEAIPLTPNGKLDTAALLAQLPAAVGPNGRGAHGPADALPPVSAEDRELLEQPLPALVAAVFADLTGQTVEHVPADATLVQLGATSLDAGRVAARLGQALGRAVPVSQVFRTPSVRGLARWLAETAGDPAAGPSLVKDGRVVEDAPVPLTPLQQYFLIEHLAAPDDISQHCVGAWRVAGRPNRRTLRAAVEYVHRRHPALSCRYVLDETPVALPVGTPVPPMREIVVDTEAEAQAALARELGRPFRLEAGYVWQAVFVAVRQTPVTYLGVAAHHIAFDGTSTAVLAADLGAAYRALRAGTRPQLPPAPGPAEVAEVRRDQLRYLDRAAQEAHWRTALDGIRDLALPPADFGPAAEPRSAGQPSAAVLHRRISAGTVRGLAALAARASVSSYVVHLSAYAEALGGLTGQADFGVLTPVSLRGDAVLEHAVNCLINPICMRLRPHPDGSPDLAVGETAKVVADAFAAQDLSLPEIAALLGLRVDGGRAPLAQTMLALQDTTLPVLDLGDLGTCIVMPLYPDVPDEIVAGMWPADAEHAFPGVPAELFGEVWPGADGTARILVHYQPGRAPRAFAERLADAFAARLERYAQAPSAP
ncbi:amino acid adenylation domain-containing protein [Streptacidiphilus sp. N1-3]|uniref:Amino acid adenylation domain-containing protein n=1 Tax=Streptacidiphilus alkalitolerans TaxID=3342712 RepID=A0ABV6WZQ4_9ACTN